MVQIHENHRIVKRDHEITMYAWEESQSRLDQWHQDNDKQHLFVASIMAVVALESFLNNIVEFYRSDEYPGYINGNGMKCRIRCAADLLGCTKRAHELDGWSDLCLLLVLRDRIVHRKTQSNVWTDGEQTQVDDGEIDWTRAPEKIASVKQWILDLYQHLQWDSQELEGQQMHSPQPSMPIRERFDSFFTPAFFTTKENQHETL